eukprot:6211969-Pleurochrysis_carterae.AAC.4
MQILHPTGTMHARAPPPLARAIATGQGESDPLTMAAFPTDHANAPAHHTQSGVQSGVKTQTRTSSIAKHEAADGSAMEAAAGVITSMLTTLPGWLFAKRTVEIWTFAADMSVKMALAQRSGLAERKYAVSDELCSGLLRLGPTFIKLGQARLASRDMQNAVMWDRRLYAQHLPRGSGRQDGRSEWEEMKRDREHCQSAIKLAD